MPVRSRALALQRLVDETPERAVANQLLGLVAGEHRVDQHPRSAVLPSGGGNVGQVVARLSLDMRERELQFALGDLRQQRLL